MKESGWITVVDSSVFRRLLIGAMPKAMPAFFQSAPALQSGWMTLEIQHLISNKFDDAKRNLPFFISATAQMHPRYHGHAQTTSNATHFQAHLVSNTQRIWFHFAINSKPLPNVFIIICLVFHRCKIKIQREKIVSMKFKW